MHIAKRKTLAALAALLLPVTAQMAYAQDAALADKPKESMQAAAPKVKFNTSVGDIVVQLDPIKAPKTVANFLGYVQDKFYNGTIFHRVIGDFMIQGGGFTANMKQKPTKPPVVSESNNGLKNDKYTIAMARSGDPNSATAQFFINIKDNDSLNAPNPDGYGYTVFGKVVQGQEVVDRIKSVRTGSKGIYQNVPIEPITILSATLVE